MKRTSLLAVWQSCTFASLLSLALAIRITASPSPLQGVERAGTSEQELTVAEEAEEAEEKDSYEIYSMLLRTELGPTWKITTWTINQETQTFPSLGPRPHYIRQCLSVSRTQEGIYAPLIDDYLAKNNGKHPLKRKFDLPRYELVDFGRTPATSSSSFPASVIFEVSARRVQSRSNNEFWSTWATIAAVSVVAAGIICWSKQAASGRLTESITGCLAFGLRSRCWL